MGCGFVGLTNAILLAQDGKVNLWDLDFEKMKRLEQQMESFSVPSLKNSWKEICSNFVFYRDMYDFMDRTDLFLLALPTNYDEEEKCLNTTCIRETIEQILLCTQGREIQIVIRSTVPVGFTDQMKKVFDTQKIFFMPEFLRESSALYDIVHPDRVVVGGSDSSEELAAWIDRYIRCIKKAGGKPPEIQYVSSTEAEAIKLFSNAYLAMRVSFFNELDMFVEKKGLNSWNVIRGVCADTRIGDGYNNPSFGFGGYCLPKDTTQLATQLGEDGVLISAILQSNDNHKNKILEAIQTGTGVVGIYRLQVNPNAKALRQSVSLELFETLKESGKKLLLYEPLIKTEMKETVIVVNSVEELYAKSDIIVADRVSDELLPYLDKVYTRDLFMKKRGR